MALPIKGICFCRYGGKEKSGGQGLQKQEAQQQAAQQALEKLGVIAKESKK